MGHVLVAVLLAVCCCALLLPAALASAGGAEPQWPPVLVTEHCYDHDGADSHHTVNLFSVEAIMYELRVSDLGSILQRCEGRPFCVHSLCHHIGEALFRLNNTNLPIKCAAHCVGGCLHGFLESYFQEYAQGVPVDMLPLMVEQTCAALPASERGNCLHGLAHGLYDLHGKEVGTDVCYGLSSHAYKLMCAGGVAMMEIQLVRSMAEMPLCEVRNPLGCWTYATMSMHPSALPRMLDGCYEWYGTEFERSARRRGYRGAGQPPGQHLQEERSLGHDDVYALEHRRFLLPCIYGALQTGIQHGDYPVALCVGLPTQAQRFACIDGWTRRERLFVDMEAECEATFGAALEDARDREEAESIAGKVSSGQGDGEGGGGGESGGGGEGGDESGDQMDDDVVDADAAEEGFVVEVPTVAMVEEMRRRCVSRANMRNHDVREDWSLYPL
eukprot:TRINITY_DN2706_c0_g1_i1.p1 TRINITY_DN2706_c0_g1~~TRINITY_DN2706_c0_g1_i1.p1  ORF type:complete len:443 (-),score=102.43 TRINITY_DN2706_c0_g1_i1:175-1503(-)